MHVILGFCSACLDFPSWFCCQSEAVCRALAKKKHLETVINNNPFYMQQRSSCASFIPQGKEERNLIVTSKLIRMEATASKVKLHLHVWDILCFVTEQ